MAKTLLPLASSGVFVPASAEAVAADIERLDGAVSDLAEDVGALEQLDAGDIPFDPTETYADGSTGAALSNALSEINHLSPFIMATFPQTTITDEPIATFTDGADGVPLKALTVDVDPVQDLHGQSNPYPAGGGKNKIPLTIDNLKSINATGTWTGNAYAWNGITFTVQTDSVGNVIGISVNGTATANSVLKLAVDLPVEQGEKLNGAPSGGRLYVSSANGSVDYAGDTGSGATINTTDSEAYCFIQILNGTSPSNVVYKPMIRAASEADATFAPYSNICPISGWTGANISDTGVNVWDEEIRNGYYGADTGNFNSLSSSIANKNPIPVKPNKTYYLKSGTYNVNTFYYDADMHYLSSGYHKQNTTFTTPANCAFLNICNDFGSGGTYANDISVNLPSTDTSYHAYTGSVLPITFPDTAGTVYGGTLDVTNGVLTVGYAEENMSTFTWTYDSEVKRWASTSLSGRIVNFQGRSADLLSDRWTADTSTNTGDEYKMFTAYNNIYCYTSNGTNEPTGQLVFPLKNPLTYQLTPQEVSSLLGLNNLWADTGDVDTLTYRVDPASYQSAQTAQIISALAAMLAYTETSYTATRAYSANDFVSVNNVLYKVTASISNGGTITPNTNCVATTVGAQLTTILNS